MSRPLSFFSKRERGWAFLSNQDPVNQTQQSAGRFSGLLKNKLGKKGAKLLKAGTRLALIALKKLMISLALTVGLPALIVIIFFVLLSTAVFGYWGATHNYTGIQAEENIIEWDEGDPQLASWNEENPTNKQIAKEYEELIDNSMDIRDYYNKEEDYKLLKGILIALDKFFCDDIENEGQPEKHIDKIGPEFEYKDSTIEVTREGTEKWVVEDEEGNTSWESNTWSKDDTREITEIELLESAETFAGDFYIEYEEQVVEEEHATSGDNYYFYEKTITTKKVPVNETYVTNQIEPLKEYMIELDEESDSSIVDPKTDHQWIMGLANNIDASHLDLMTSGEVVSLGVNYKTGSSIYVSGVFGGGFSFEYRELTELDSSHEYYSLIDEIARKYSFDPNLINAIIKNESGYDPEVESRAGAVGLMQLMPDTARDLGLRVDDNIDERLFPYTNVDAGTRYIRDLIDQYNSNIYLALAAYNAGPGNLDEWIDEVGTNWSELKDVGFDETIKYVEDVLKDWGPAPLVSIGDYELVVPVTTECSYITSHFGYRIDPITGELGGHEGIDIGCWRYYSGSNVVSAANGIVTFAGWSGGYGNVVIIDHGGGFETRYAHLNSIHVSQGQEVFAGHTVGTGGSTGKSTGPHLHFETRIDGEPIDPLSFYCVSDFERPK